VTRLRRLADRAQLTTARACVEFVEDRGHRNGAQIAFFAVLSFVPLALLLVGAFGLVFDGEEVRDRVVATVFDNVPLAQESDRDDLEETVIDALDGAGNLGPLSILLLLAGASGVMGALRHAVNQAWDIKASRPLLRRKALDLALVFGAVVVLVLSLALTATRAASDEASDEGEGGSVLAVALDGVADLLPFVFTAAVIAFLYRILPAERPALKGVLPGAVLAAALVTVVRQGLELYFEHLSDFGALYGSLGALMALLLFVFAAAMVFVFGAEFASEWCRLPEEDDEVRRRVRDGRRRLLRRGS
jgi:membrane protein